MLEHAEHLKRKMLFDVCDSYHRIHTVLQSLHETVVLSNSHTCIRHRITVKKGALITILIFIHQTSHLS